MSIMSAALHRAIASVWNEHLNPVFLSYWNEGDRSIFPTLHDGEATPKQPFPYCVFVLQPGDVQFRMTGHTPVENHYIRRIQGEFNIHTKSIHNMSAKAFGSILAETLMAKFGGHPTEQPVTFPELACGYVLQVSYIDDYGVRTGDDEYQWVVDYEFLLDVPVRV